MLRAWQDVALNPALCVRALEFPKSAIDKPSRPHGLHFGFFNSCNWQPFEACAAELSVPTVTKSCDVSAMSFSDRLRGRAFIALQCLYFVLLSCGLRPTAAQCALPLALWMCIVQSCFAPRGTSGCFLRAWSWWLRVVMMRSMVFSGKCGRDQAQASVSHGAVLI